MKIAVRTLAIAVFVIGAVVLSRYFFECDCEQWLFKGHLAGIRDFAPGRMAPNTAVGMVVAGIAIFLLTCGRLNYIRTQILACLLAASGYFTLIGYLYGFAFMNGIGRFTHMALPTGISFLLLSQALLFYHPSCGLTMLLTDRATAGFTARRLIPSALLIPLILGAITVRGQLQGLYDWDFGAASIVVATTVVLLTLIGITSRSISSVDEERLRLSDQRDNFMAVLIHDLKTPLIGADRVLEHLLDSILEPLTPKQRVAAELLKKSNGELLDMVKNLLELYRLDRDKETLCFSSIEIPALVDRVVSKLRRQTGAQDKDVRIRFPEHVHKVNADPIALEQVLSNLVQNAIKFTPANGIIEVSVEELENWVLIKVRDTGRGMSQSEQDKLFKPFSQGEAGRQFTSGTGLGLYLCHQITKAHKGHLTCLSEAGVGTTFIISLSAVPEPIQSNSGGPGLIG